MYKVIRIIRQEERIYNKETVSSHNTREDAINAINAMNNNGEVNTIYVEKDGYCINIEREEILNSSHFKPQI